MISANEFVQIGKRSWGVYTILMSWGLLSLVLVSLSICGFALLIKNSGLGRARFPLAISVVALTVLFIVGGQGFLVDVDTVRAEGYTHSTSLLYSVFIASVLAPALWPELSGD